jgi:hypothetical protein
MATTTPNYGWDVPTSSDYVKQGAVAIETLGDDIDATLFSVTGGKGVGLQLLTNTSFTTQSAVNFTNVFSSAYTFYKIVMTVNGSGAATNLNCRFRENTTDKAAGYYGASGIAAFGGQFQIGDAFNNTAQFTLRFVASLAAGIISLDLFRTATNAEMTGTLFDVPNGQAAFIGINNVGMSNFTGFSIYPSAGTITGNVKIYGYKESI